MPKSVQDFLNEKNGNLTYSNLGSTLVILQDTMREDARLNNKELLIERKKLEEYANALKYLGGRNKDEAGITKSIETLKDFGEYLAQVPKRNGNTESNFQLLCSASYTFEGWDQFMAFMENIKKVNQDLNLGISTEKKEFELDAKKYKAPANFRYGEDNSSSDNEDSYDTLKNDSFDEEDNKKENNNNIIKSNENVNNNDNNEKDDNDVQVEDLDADDDEYEDENKNENENENENLLKKDNREEKLNNSDPNKTVIYNKKTEKKDNIFEVEDSSSEDSSVYDSDDNDLTNEALLDKSDTALNWIDGFKEDAKEKGEDYRLIAARIFAARILVDSVPGSKSSLKKQVNGIEIDRVAKQLMDNVTFSEFVNGMKKSELKEYIGKYGHGGKLEEKFKNYILHLEAGQLHNDKILDRFMPRVIDRIDVLKGYARKKGSAANQSAEIIETIALRTMIGAKRNQPETLIYKIPTSGYSLPNLVDSLASSDAGYSIGNNENVKKDMLEGHGGQMMVNLWTKAQNSPGSYAQELMEDIVEPAKPGKQYERLQTRARGIVQQITKECRVPKDKRDTLKLRTLGLEAREILAEAIAIHNYMSVDKNYPNNMPKTYAQNQKALQKGVEILTKNDVFKKTLFPQNTIQNHFDELNKLIINPSEYAAEANQRIREAAMEAKKQAGKGGPEKNTNPVNNNNIINNNNNNNIEKGHNPGGMGGMG